jgi:hypothetical protein
MSKSVLYFTGANRNNQLLIGGIWKLWEQEGFPIELSNIVCKDNLVLVDWLEAMLDASCSNNCPSLMTHLESFLSEAELFELKIRFVSLLKSGKTYEELLLEKRKNSQILEELINHIQSQLKK